MNTAPSTNHSEQRIQTITYIILFFFGCISGMLMYLQLYHADFFSKMSECNYTRKRQLSCRRGAITDRNGVLLATDRPIVALFWQGKGAKRLSDQHKILIEHIQREIGELDASTKQIEQAERYQQKLLLADNIPFETLARIMEYYNSDEHIVIEARPIRYYPNGKIACHVVGCLRQTPQTTAPEALMGLEKIVEDQLRGNPGIEEYIVDSRGRCITKNIHLQSLDGTKVATTIDIHAQTIAEELLSEFSAGTILVMDPEQGDILVMASNPTFDPNLFTQTISTETWQNYITTKPFVNRALGSCYPPASLFKLVTAAAALEEGLVNTESHWNCQGKLVCGDTEFHCHNKYGHGNLNLIDAIAYSCNIPFYEIGKNISIDHLAEYAQSFGFGQPTGILLPERTGLIPTTTWKKTTLGQRWQKGETMLVSIGQSYSLVTPLQTICFISALGSGRRVRPKILCNESIHLFPLPISNHTRTIILQGMKKGIEQGTSQLLKQLKNCTIYGKTGTAQVCSKKKSQEHQEDETLKNHGWFVGYIVPNNQKPLAIMVFLEHVGSARTAVATAYKFLQRWLFC